LTRGSSKESLSVIEISQLRLLLFHSHIIIIIMIALTRRSKDRSIFRDKLPSDQRPSVSKIAASSIVENEHGDEHCSSSSLNDAMPSKMVQSPDASAETLAPPSTVQDTSPKMKRKWWKTLSKNNSEANIPNKSDETKSKTTPKRKPETKARNFVDKTSMTDGMETDSDAIPSGPLESDWDDDDVTSILPLESFSEEHDDDMQVLTFELKGIQRLERQLELKRERLRRLCAGRGTSYVRLMEANNAAADAVTLAAYTKAHAKTAEKNPRNDNNGIDGTSSKECDPDDTKKDRAHSIGTKEEATSSGSDMKAKAKGKPSTAMSIRWILLFELYHTLPAFAIVLVVLMGHICFYCGLETSLKSIYYTFLNQCLSLDQFMGIQVILGLCMIRINGSVFYWLDRNDFHLVRMELQNRLILGTFDTQVMKRLKGTMWSSALNMFGYYIASVALFHFYYSGHLKVLQPLEEWYVDIFQTAGGTYSATGQVQTPPCHKLAELVAPSGEYSQKLIHYFCMDETQEWRAVGLVYNGLWLVVTAVLGMLIGQNMLEYCD
jgi:hypothetical protein